MSFGKKSVLQARAALPVVLIACVTGVMSCGRAERQSEEVKRATQSKPASGWDLFNQPELVAGARGYSQKFSNLPLAATLEKKPWLGAYWPHQTGGIAFRWLSRNPENFTYVSPTREQVAQMSQDELGRLSPAEKIDIFNGRFDYPSVKREWERTGPRSLPWEGLCDGLAVSQLLFPEPKPVLMKSAAGIDVPFGSADVKALLSLEKGLTSRPRQDVVGIQCVSNNAANDALCKTDMNAGTFHVVLANQIGLLKEGFLADVDWTEEVWNHVVYGYQSQVVGTQAPSPGAAPGTVKELRVQTQIMQSLIRPADWNVQPANDDLDGFVQYEYVLELDVYERIIGGTWISEEHPDFLWTIDTAAEADFAKLDRGIAAIYKASLAPARPAPQPAPDVSPTPLPTPVATVAPTAVPTSVPTVAPTAAPTSVPTVAPTAAPTSVPTVAPTPVRNEPVAIRGLQHLSTLVGQISLTAVQVGAVIRNVTAQTHVCDIRLRYSTYFGNDVRWGDSDTLRGVEIYARTEATPMTRIEIPAGHKMRSVQALARCENETGFTPVSINLRP